MKKYKPHILIFLSIILGIFVCVDIIRIICTKTETAYTNALSLLIGVISLILSICVLYIAHGVKLHIASKVAFNSVRELYETLKKASMHEQTMDSAQVKHANSVLSTALQSIPEQENYIRPRIQGCLDSLNDNTDPVSFMSLLKTTVDLINFS